MAARAGVREQPRPLVNQATGRRSPTRRGPATRNETSKKERVTPRGGRLFLLLGRRLVLGLNSTNPSPPTALDLAGRGLFQFT